MENNDMCSLVLFIVENDLQYSDVREVIGRIKQNNPHVSEDMIISGINIARRILFREEYLTDDIRKEIEMWDR